MDVSRTDDQPRSLMVVLMLGLAVWALAGTARAGAETSSELLGGALPSSIISLEAVEVGGRVAVRFSTALQESAAGYFLYRLDESSGLSVKLNEEMLPAEIGARAGSAYQVWDDSAPSSTRLTYAVVSVGPYGKNVSGPFETTVEPSTKLDGPTAVNKLESETDSRAPSSLQAEFQEAFAATPGEDAIESFAGWTQDTDSESPVRVRFEVAESGLYFVSAQELADLSGESLSEVKIAIIKRLLRLSTAGVDVPWVRAASGAGLYFYGTAPDSPYAQRNVYYLQAGQGRKPARISGRSPASGPISAMPATQRVEVDAMPVTFLASAVPGDFYYWSYISAGHPSYGSAVHQFELDDRATFTGVASIGVELLGATSTPAAPEHRAEIYVNGSLIGAATWDGAVPHTETIDFPGNLLQPGLNEIEVTGVKLAGVSYSAFLIDGFDVTYECLVRPVDDSVAFTAGVARVTVGGFSAADLLVLEVSDPLNIRKIVRTTVEQSVDGTTVSFLSRWNDRDFLVASLASARSPLSVEMVPSSSLVVESTGAEYVVVTPAALRSAADNLAAYRQGDGLSVLVAELEEIYDAFGTGLPTPEAIRAFLQHAYSTWQIQPRFVVLAGRGTFDPKDVEGYGENLLPVVLTSTPYGYFASDAYYADLTGDDYSPEVALGRIPATSSSELQQYVDKLASYEPFGTGVEPDDLILLADNPDSGGNYPVLSDELQNLVSPWTTVDRIYLSQQDLTQARSNLTQGLSNGAAWVNYIGHGAVDRFASEGLLRVGDVPTMPVSGRLPVVSAMTCSVGRFEVPAWTSLAEALVLDSTGGAAAVFSTSGQSLSFEARLINQSLFDAIYSTQVATAGEAAAEALRFYSEEGNLDFMKRIFGLLGDPAYRIR